MNLRLKGRLGAWVLQLLLLSLRSAAGQDGGQDGGQECFSRFKSGRENFVIDTDDSVKYGATFISSPKLDLHEDCLSACCKEPRCNVAFLQKADEEGSVGSCFLFDCLYKKKYACRFARKTGYVNYILDSVYESYREVDASQDESDRPPLANGGPDQVVQPQDTVTLNGIGSKDDNEIVSYRWQMVSGNPYAVIEKTTFEDQIMVSNLSSGVYKFQLTVTDSIGQSDSTKVTILVLTSEQSEHHCMAPKKVGPCRGSFPRWHYNAASEECEKFIFGGCRENLNNYLSKDECTKACYGSEKKSGTGRGLPITNLQREKCGSPCTADQFTCANGCCLDPGLECDGSPQCSDDSDEQKCEDLENKFQILLQIPVDEQKVRCTQPPDTGSCRDSNSKWYYNPKRQECSRFNYGGCLGNENRFDTKESCEKVCHGVTNEDKFVKQEQTDRLSEGQTGVIVIAAFLSISIAILLGILIYCVMKGKKKSSQHHRVPAQTAQFTSLEDRERLVYNSTTKPI